MGDNVMISLRDLNEGMKDCNVLLICPICGSELTLEKSYYEEQIVTVFFNCRLNWISILKAM